MTWYSPLMPLLLGMLLLVGAAFGTRRWLALTGLVLILPSLALMTPLGANLLVLVIEQRTKAAETAAVCDRVQAAVLLSGGLSRPAESASDFDALTHDTLARTFAWRNHDSIQNSRRLPLIIAGGGPFRVPEAEVIAEFLRTLDPERWPFQLEAASKTTWESAQALRALLPESTQRILLASSALHLPRAVLAFEKNGFEVCPLPLNRQFVAVSGWTILLPQSSSLAKSESAIHEIIGELSYRLRGEG